eukprot:scaffold2423_cov113-Isochrysis_galbana.AAC.2
MASQRSRSVKNAVYRCSSCTAASGSNVMAPPLAPPPAKSHALPAPDPPVVRRRRSHDAEPSPSSAAAQALTLTPCRTSCGARSSVRSSEVVSPTSTCGP